MSDWNDFTDAMHVANSCREDPHRRGWQVPNCPMPTFLSSEALHHSGVHDRHVE